MYIVENLLKTMEIKLISIIIAPNQHATVSAVSLAVKRKYPVKKTEIYNKDKCYRNCLSTLMKKSNKKVMMHVLKQFK